MIPRRHAAAVLALVRVILDDGRERAAADPSLTCANCGAACGCECYSAADQCEALYALLGRLGMVTA